MSAKVLVISLPNPFEVALQSDRATCILLVEDHEDSAAIAARLLRGRGYQVVIAGSVSAALSEAASQKIDLALCDIGLPDGQGTDLMRQLRAKYAMPGIALTGFALEDDELGLDACFAARLVKPIDFGELCRVVEQVLSKDEENAP